MRYQQVGWSCGAAAVVNTLRAFGRRVAESCVRTHAGTNKTGTENTGILASLRAFGLAGVEYNGTSKNHAWRWLQGALLQGSVVILSVDRWTHWVTCIGLVGDRVILIDSTNAIANKRENGIHVIPKEKLIRRWHHAKQSDEYSLYAICASKG